MEITRKQADGKLTLAVSGKLSAGTAEEFGAAVDAAISECPAIILDFGQLDYLASAGIRVLMAAQKKLKASGGTLTILNVAESIMEVFEVTGLDDIFDIQ
jgi:anti-sigma B factor antagonist